MNQDPSSSSSANWHPFFSRLTAYVTFEEVYETSITYDEVVQILQSMPTLQWLKIASMGSLYLDHYESDFSKQAVLQRTFLPADLLSRGLGPKIEGQRHLCHRRQFVALFRAALLHSSPSTELPENEDDRRELVSRCLLGLSSLLDETRPKDENDIFDAGPLWRKLTFDSRKALSSDEQSFLMGLVPHYHNYHTDFIHSILGRYKEMLFDIPQDPDFHPQGVPNNLLSDTLVKEHGLTTAQYAALTFGLFAKYISPDKLFTKDSYFPVDVETHFSNSAIPKKTIHDYFATISQSQSEFIHNERTTENAPGEIADFRQFMLKPLVHVDGDKDCYPTSLAYMQRLMDSALTWVAKAGAFDQELRNYWGQTFEFYCHKVCQRIADNSLVAPAYYPSEQYGRIAKTESSCDAILVYGRHATMLEFKIKSPRLIPSIVERDYDSFVADIRDGFVGDEQGGKAARQIDNTIRGLRSCDLRLTGIGAGTITTYFPVVVTLQPWPLGPGVYELIRMIVQAEGLLRHNYVAPLEIWSIAEFELVEAVLTSREQSPTTIPELVGEKLRGQHSSLPMATFLYDKFAGQVPLNAHVTSRRDEMIQIVVDTLALSK